ncbi:hypothetical protein [Parasedimentitalea maritima]|uniref:Uncharacterized protein n=1 Tax=Parasedimentitalea maritima TaxID=2578117 RepID=A0A6A4RDW6_9RHOB|nr:hypothetical protein [Zongyanglinia marina]KAE9625498.1 hypothetical protein GP644_22545 [Zongyanglinia marina]
MTSKEENNVTLEPTSADSIAVSKRQYRDLVQSIAFIERETRSEIAEKDFLEGEGTIHYALDSNIIRAYGAPYRHGRKAQGSFGFGQFLPRRFRPLYTMNDKSLRKLVALTNQHEDRMAGNLLKILTGAVKKRIENQKQGILQLSPHSKESRSHHKFLFERLRENPDSAKKKAKLIDGVASIALKRFVRRAQEPNAPKIPPDQYLNIVQNVYARAEEIGDLNSAAELYRFLEFCSKKTQANPFEGQDILDVYSDIPSTELFKIARHLLSKTFEELISKGERGPRAENDRDALVQLALLNKINHDERHAYGGNSARIVLITCTTEVSNAAYRAHNHLLSNLIEYLKAYPGAGTGSDLKEFLRRNTHSMERFFALSENTQREDRWFKAFGLLYVRHISGFVGELAETSDTVSEDENIDTRAMQKTPTRPESIALFSGLFLEQTARTELPLTVLSDIIDDPERFVHVPPGFRTSFIDLLKKWSNFIEDALGRTDIQVSTKLEDEALKQAFLQGLGFDATRRNKVHIDMSAILSDIVERSRDRMILEFSFHGTELASIAGRTSRRTPPDLFFRNLEVSFSMFRSMSINANYPGSTKWLRDYDQIVEDCDPKASDDRWENHLKFLVLAASFSCLENWSVASGHLSRALDIINRAKRPGLPPIETRHQTNPSGREASFLQSVCERMLADDAIGLKKAANALKASESCADADSKKDSMNSKPGFIEPISSLRYRNEELSIALAQYYLKRMESCGGEAATVLEGEVSSEKLHECDPEIKVLKSCYEQLKAHEDFDLVNIETATIVSETDMQRQMHGLTHISAATNIVQLAVIDQYWQQGNQKGMFINDNGEREPAGLNDCLFQALRYLVAAKKGEAIEMSLTHVYRRVASMILDKDNASGKASKIELEPITFEECDEFFKRFRKGDFSKIERWRYESVHAFVKRLHSRYIQSETSNV